MPTPVFLSHRSIISVTGADAEPFLNNIVTVSTLGLAPGELRYGALLTPQGKVIADLLLTRESDAILIDCDAAAAPALSRRLTMMKLRAAVAIKERHDLGVTAFEAAQLLKAPPPVVVLRTVDEARARAVTEALRPAGVAVLVDRKINALPVYADVAGLTLQIAPGDVIECNVPPYEPEFAVDIWRPHAD